MLTEMSKVQKVTSEEADRIIDTRKPLGRFFTISKVKGKRVYVGIANDTGDAWTEDFKCKQTCVNWLNGTGRERGF